MLPLLIFLTFAFAGAGLYVLTSPTATQRRVNALAPELASGWTVTALRLAQPLAGLSTPEGAWEGSPLRIQFAQAGLRHPDARILYYATRTVLPLLLSVLVYAYLRNFSAVGSLPQLFYVLCGALAGVYLPNVLLRWHIARRKREIVEAFPDASDLMLVCVDAGLGLDAAFTRVAEEIRVRSRALADELHLTNLELRAGATRETSLRHLAVRTGVAELSQFASMLVQADKFGTDVADSLRVFSDELRHKRQMRAEEAAAKVPTKLLFPLVLFIFPSIIMVIMGPAAIRVVRTLLPLINGPG